MTREKDFKGTTFLYWAGKAKTNGLTPHLIIIFTSVGPSY
jgi:hypothetical protein